MVSDADKRRFMRDMAEDYDDFLASHREESKGNRSVWVDARMIALPGQVLMTMMKMGWIDYNGQGVRPMRHYTEKGR